MRVRLIAELIFTVITKQKPPNRSAKTFRGLRYLTAQFRALVVILKDFFEHVVDETPYDAFHDSFHDFFDAFFCAFAELPHRYHPLTQNYNGGVG